jgi:hypothetical protein
VTELAQRLLAHWDAFWFAPGSAVDLGIARVLILGYFVCFKLRDRAYDFRAWEAARSTLRSHWQRPWLLQVLRVPYLPRSTDAALAVVFKVSLVLGAIGLFTQVSCAIALVVGLYLLGMRHGLRTHHTVIPIKFCLLAFALAPAGHAISVDALLLPMLGHDLAPRPELYGWGLQLIRVVLSTAICATAFAKMRHFGSGASFLYAGNLADLLRIHDFPYFHVQPIFSISPLIRRHRWLEAISAHGTLVIELGFPVVLFWPPAALVFAPAFAGMVLGFRLFIGARFDQYLVILIAVFVPWSRLVQLAS